MTSHSPQARRDPPVRRSGPDGHPFRALPGQDPEGFHLLPLWGVLIHLDFLNNAFIPWAERQEPMRLLDDTIRPIVEGTELCITDVPRTITDCFRHRRAIGLDVAIRALREAIQRRLCTPAELALIARKHRAWNIIRPYLEAILLPSS